MARKVVLWPLAIVAIIVVWLFAFGGASYFIGAPYSPGNPASGIAFDTSVKSLSDGGNGVIQLGSDGRSATISGTRAQLAGESTVNLGLAIRQLSNKTTDSFQVSVDGPSYSTGGNTFRLLKTDSSGCPQVVYSQAGDGSGVQTTSPCGFSGSLGSMQTMTLTLSMSVNSAFFTNSPAPFQYSATVHTSSGNDVTITWVITG